MAAAAPSVDETLSSLAEVTGAVAKLNGGRAAGVCNVIAEMLKADP